MRLQTGKCESRKSWSSGDAVGFVCLKALDSRAFRGWGLGLRSFRFQARLESHPHTLGAQRNSRLTMPCLGDFKACLQGSVFLACCMAIAVTQAVDMGIHLELSPMQEPL